VSVGSELRLSEHTGAGAVHSYALLSLTSTDYPVDFNG